MHGSKINILVARFGLYVSGRKSDTYAKNYTGPINKRSYGKYRCIVTDALVRLCFPSNESARKVSHFTFKCSVNESLNFCSVGMSESL